jgi:hypothetical protein
MPNRTQKEYYQDNKEYINNRNKLYREKNKDKHKEYQQEYQQEYRKENKNKQEKYYENNKESILKKRKEYYKNNREKIIEKNKNYVYKQLEENPLYKFRHNVRSLIRTSIKKRGGKKLTKTELILGCTFEEFRTYIESLWEPWMNWDNYGNPKDGIFEPNKTWDFDHVVPVTQGMSELEILKLNYHTNLQPLCSYNNRFIKRDN